ncbi:Uncharacterised protein [Delftia tsuruhatensis]|nr:Uncharacterised protein [Delftia tsuruhatensis]CAC9684711.1 Uncharacterised protein [Delftia tsuruhatensis]
MAGGDTDLLQTVEVASHYPYLSFARRAYGNCTSRLVPCYGNTIWGKPKT